MGESPIIPMGFPKSLIFEHNGAIEMKEENEQQDTIPNKISRGYHKLLWMYYDRLEKDKDKAVEVLEILEDLSENGSKEAKYVLNFLKKKSNLF